jgi:glycosyltransferase involved in cell wall biosynthesis
VIQHGQNGLLAASPEEWLIQLDSMIEDPAERARLGSAGRQTVEEGYSMSRCAERFAAVVEETVESRRILQGFEAPKAQPIRE